MEELLESPVVRDVAIRFICSLRKCLLEAKEPSSDDVDLGYDVNRLYMSLSLQDKKVAFENGRAVHNKRNLRALPVILPTPEPEPEPEPAYAPRFTVDRARALLLLALESIGSNKSATFTEIKTRVEKEHLSGGKTWRADELAVASNSLKCWENRLQSELKKLRMGDVLVYRSTKSDYFIF